MKKLKIYSWKIFSIHFLKLLIFKFVVNVAFFFSIVPYILCSVIYKAYVKWQYFYFPIKKFHSFFWIFFSDGWKIYSREKYIFYAIFMVLSTLCFTNLINCILFCIFLWKLETVNQKDTALTKIRFLKINFHLLIDCKDEDVNKYSFLSVILYEYT